MTRLEALQAVIDYSGMDEQQLTTVHVTGSPALVYSRDNLFVWTVEDHNTHFRVRGSERWQDWRTVTKHDKLS